MTNWTTLAMLLFGLIAPGRGQSEAPLGQSETPEATLTIFFREERPLAPFGGSMQISGPRLPIRVLERGNIGFEPVAVDSPFEASFLYRPARSKVGRGAAVKWVEPAPPKVYRVSIDWMSTPGVSNNDESTEGGHRCILANRPA